MIWLYAILIWLAPLYVWRFELVGLPANFFLVALGLVVSIGFIDIIRNRVWQEYFSKLQHLPKVIRWAVILFFFASILSLFVNGVDLAKVGQWLVLYLLPIVGASQVYFFASKHPDQKQYVISAMYVMMGILGLVALVQYFFLIGLPVDYWGNSQEPKRAIGFFAHPNGFSLFITPILAYLLPDLKKRIEKYNWRQVWLIAFWLLGAFGLLVSLSRGGWLGLAAAITIFVIFSSSKKLLLGYAIFAIILCGVIVAVPNLRYRVILPFMGEKSSVARFSLWETGWKMVQDSPLLGQGVNGFNYNWDKFNSDPNLQHYNFPHNFLLNTWIDLGLLGLVSWLVMVLYGLWQMVKRRSNSYVLGLSLFLIAILVHGLIDIPYFKNDLAFIFWLIFALSI